ncbi:EamA family transporter [Mesorhizobium sp. CA18]|nr:MULTISPECIES: EamA family transporter [unclassified Mesorhizobium]MBZ9834092.1 EamA family transporter [Mesorhizobium sp. CA2]MBZ9736820.1 EamA family transporter [Mesorhizobium sp. CA9]MBZ9825363.1 EamA family transporter [Mesorhizobium sp. CA18]MBZ9836444.1 EamA family transporter [Mesorhizobium sp. CA3]MBZ9878064.1 EamA family transporter [Mesorhizobium sp. Ca11]
MADARDSGNSRLAIIAGLIMIGIYAIQFVAARFSLREHLTATDLAALRFGGAGVVFLPIVWHGGFVSMRALGWRRALALAALAGLPYPLIINWGLTYAPAAHAAALCPASIVFFSFLL